MNGIQEDTKLSKLGGPYSNLKRAAEPAREEERETEAPVGIHLEKTNVGDAENKFSDGFGHATVLSHVDVAFRYSL